ncbi:MAG TPA: hypothetical protein VMN36_05285 [Verrucomicrobiales bacterium]|nr:hypothetical protein [Verrucomicrobiales bacterium]
MIIPPAWSLPESIRIRLGTSTYGQQRAIVEEGHLLLVLHKPPGPDDSKREGVLFWRSPEGEWQCNRGGPGIGGVKRHVQDYAGLETKLTADFERAMTLDGLFEVVAALTPLVRASRSQHAAIQAAREAVKGDVALIELRDQAYEVVRNLELLLEDARNEIQFRTAREAENQARLGRAALHASHRLNTLAALFFPLMAVTSLFGMNFAHGFDAGSPLIFWAIFFLGVALGFVMKGWVLARPREDKLVGNRFSKPAGRA